VKKNIIVPFREINFKYKGKHGQKEAKIGWAKYLHMSEIGFYRM